MALRYGFAFWQTRPQQVQTDGETTLVGRSGVDFPTPFTMWLVGLDIDHLRIRPGRPTDNSEVERGHHTVNDYAIIGTENMATPDLCQTLARSVYELIFELPSSAKNCQGRTPIEAYPELLSPTRSYSLHEELTLFDSRRIDSNLVSLSWSRKVSEKGQIQLGGRGRRYTFFSSRTH